VTPTSLVERFYREMWNAFDVDVLSEITSEDVRFRGSLGDETVGREELEDYVRTVQRAFPDFTNEIIELVSDSSRAFARLRYRGTHLGPLGSVGPTGRTVSYDGAALFHTDGPRITSVWVLGDRLALLRQLGQDHTGGAVPSS
jgi:steroid delta-isomerase-like uncharacterized protein